MPEKRSRCRFTAEFKTQAIKRLVEGSREPSEMASGLGLSTGPLSMWRTEQFATGSAEMLATRKAEETETLWLRRELKGLEEENLILSKSAVALARGIA
jgi:transposase